MAESDGIDVIFSFDPTCPWTWRTSRWLTEVANARELQVEWKSFSLALLNKDKPTPPQFAARRLASSRALRLVEALQADGHREEVARFYTELGARIHDRGEEFNDDAILAAADAAGVSEWSAALDDPAWDGAIAASHDAAVQAAGPDVGSPILELPGVPRGLNGPILGEPLRGDDALRLWDAVAILLTTPQFYEIRRGRR